MDFTFHLKFISLKEIVMSLEIVDIPRPRIHSSPASTKGSPYNMFVSSGASEKAIAAHVCFFLCFKISFTYFTYQ